MKKLTILLPVLFLTHIALAQDIIITKEAQQIQAKITEVSKDFIKYLDFDNQDGPVFVLETVDVVSIVFANGQVKVYNNSEQTMGDNTMQQNHPAQETNELRFRKIDDYYILGNEKMTKSEYLVYIQKNCPEAWESYNKGNSLLRAGCGMLGGGIGFLVSGVILTGVGFGIDVKGVGYFGIAAMSLGAGLFIPGSIPLIVIGKVKTNNSHEVFNEHCALQNHNLTFAIQASQNGIGLAMNF